MANQNVYTRGCKSWALKSVQIASKAAGTEHFLKLLDSHLTQQTDTGNL